MTTRGDRFISSLQDGRKVWLDGRQVESVADHPAFRGTLQTIKRLFDMVDDPAVRDEVGYKAEGRTDYWHSSFLVPYSRDDLDRRNRAFTAWAKGTHGVMSRLSDYARTYITSWYGARKELGQLHPHLEHKITSYYKEARENDLFLTTAAADPQIDRSRGLDDGRNADRYLHVVRETSEGIVVRGAKMIATGAPYTHDFIINSVQPVESHRQHALLMIVPANSPGLHIICRESFAELSDQEHPLSSRYEEMDAVLVFDDVLVPWERVLLYGDPAAIIKVRDFHTTRSLAFHHAGVRLLAKLEFVTGVAFAVAESIGAESFLHVKQKLGELLIQVHTVRGLLVASEAEAKPDASGILVPAYSYIETAKNIGSTFYPRAIEILQQVGGGGFMQPPSGFANFEGPFASLVERYFEGANVGAAKKVQLFKLAWDLVGSQLGSRHELYERFYAGDPIRGYANQYIGEPKAYYTDPVWKLLAETEPALLRK
ncbi:4-hydroxyphenylacetate 3-hydroxylase N-terminal domain-containing protein [Paenibacillus filicis]|uniref:4-hydroxyphenylacetate 3-hydroxylase N-terminal domain-containing protein n=1 Tax=Paenibacillus filicis TaxID=669464 RepID=A0ABU9DD05_9BACL